MKKLSIGKKAEILAAYNPTFTLQKIAELTSVSVCSVLRVLEENKICKPSLPKGAKKKLSLRKETSIIRKFVDKEFSFASDASRWAKDSFEISVSGQTVRRILKTNGLKSRSKLKKPELTKNHVKERLRFARFYKNYDIIYWKKIIFSDESKFNLHGADGNRRVWCMDGTQLLQANVQGTKKFGGGNIMVWGCITSKGVGKILRVSNKINSAEYCNTLLNGLVQTYYLENLRPSEYTFQQDNASCHTSRETLEWLRTNNIPTVRWPSNSPDLNPIEHVWAYLDKAVRARSKSFSSPDKLWEIVEEEWYKIPFSYIESLYFSMCSRIKEVIKAKGFNTRY